MIVLDTSFLVALHNTQDAHHARARSTADDFEAGRWGRGVLLEYVFLETMTVMLVRQNLDSATRAGRLLLAAGDLDFVPCSELFASVFEAFTEQPGTRLSFADVAIAGFARRYADGHVLTFDREFAKLPGLRLWPA